jgi:hypothetical protein
VNKVLGVAIITLALAIIITPQFLNCEAQGRILTLANGTTTPMKCLWSARAEIAAGVPVLIIGAMTLFVRRKESYRYLGLLGTILGVFVLLIPTALIGVCRTAMVCNTVMRPSLMLFGSLVIVAFLTGLVLSFRKWE